MSEDGQALPASQRGTWSSFLKSIASFSGDLSSMTAPPFILSPTSLTEFPAYWCERPHLFAAIAAAPPGQQRALAVLKWFISTLKDQYTSRNEKMGSEKKPLNPVLGELFYGTWPDKNGRGLTKLLVEQVSHHPPITAYFIQNKDKGLYLQGHNAQKTAFSGGSITVKQIGHAILTITGPDGNPAEQYLITLPRLQIDGLWYGSPYIELADTSYIIGGGFVTTIEYKGKGYFYGKSHGFKATVTSAPGSKQSVSDVVIEGTWTTTSRVTKGTPPGISSHDDFHNVNAPKEEVTVHGGNSDGTMGPFETRKLWGAVARGIREGDFDTASREKTKIENEQRQRRKDETAAETPWQLKHFKHIDNDPIYESLAPLAKLDLQTDDAYVFLGNGPVLE